MNTSRPGMVVGIVVLCAILAFTSPSKSQFTEFMSSNFIKQMNNEDLNANPLAKQFAKGFANLFLDNVVQEKDYFIFKTFTIDLHLIRAFNSDVKDVKFIGIAGQFIPLDSNMLRNLDDKRSSADKQTSSQTSIPNTPDNTGTATSQLNSNDQSGSTVSQASAPPTQLVNQTPAVSTTKHGAVQFQNVLDNTDLNAMMQAIYSGNGEQLSNAFGKLKLSDKPAPLDKAQSRKLNALGLTEFKSGNYAAAESNFTQAYNLNAGDPEAVNNIAYAQLKAGKYQQARQNLEKTLLISPDRASAWFNLSEDLVYENQSAASACSALALGLKFSKNRDKSIEFMNQRIAEESNSSVKDKLLSALECAIAKSK